MTEAWIITDRLLRDPHTSGASQSATHILFLLTAQHGDRSLKFIALTDVVVAVTLDRWRLHGEIQSASGFRVDFDSQSRNNAYVSSRHQWRSLYGANGAVADP